jgi:hypothetical protein
MTNRETLIGVAVVVGLLASGCVKRAQPTFGPGTYTPDPSAYAGVTTSDASEILGRMTTSITMVEPELQQPLYGDARLSVSDTGLLVLNLRHPGFPGRSPCSFWFRAPIDPTQWQTSSDSLQVQLLPDQYAVEENCGSLYDESLLLTVSFGSGTEGEDFLDLMAALQQQDSATDFEGL